ncbi:MAG: phosphoenolpyruvate--protein phosphotransferase [Desulfobacterales bacterium]|nr:phosphoenolpyruvate--protein phosphotransferase [Desulfobacterales bacterium]
MTVAYSTQEIKLQGISGSPGICIGKAYLVDQEGVNVIEKYAIEAFDIQNEVNRFKKAVKKAKNALKKIIDQTSEELRQHIRILETHLVLHQDKMLYEKTIETIEKEKINAEWALKKVCSNIKEMFNEIPDPFLKSRIADVIQVADHIMRNLLGANPIDIGGINKRVILVATDLSPADTSQIKLDQVMGFITDRGGRTSHTSIIARTLDIPAVLGLDQVTRLIKNDDILIVDGSSGLVIINPSEETINQYQKQKNRIERQKNIYVRESHLPATTKDGSELIVLGNIELPEEVVSVLDKGGDGIGLFRSEFLYMSRADFPTEEELYDRFKDVIEVMFPKSVTIRTLDINGDKAILNAVQHDEANPALGLRGIRFCLKRQDVFKSQIRAILRAAYYGHVKILFPMISCVEEIIAANNLINECKNELYQEGKPFGEHIDVGIMIEVPSAVIMADMLADFVDFFSIGTNDLIQYTMAIDRTNKSVAYLYQALHPSIIRMLKHIVTVSTDKKIGLCMCGEMAGDPVNLPILIGLGFKELSVNPTSIPVIKSITRQLTRQDTATIVNDALKQKTASDIFQLIKVAYGDTINLS